MTTTAHFDCNSKQNLLDPGLKTNYIQSQLLHMATSRKVSAFQTPLVGLPHCSTTKYQQPPCGTCDRHHPFKWKYMHFVRFWGNVRGLDVNLAICKGRDVAIWFILGEKEVCDACMTKSKLPVVREWEISLDFSFSCSIERSRIKTSRWSTFLHPTSSLFIHPNMGT